MSTSKPRVVVAMSGGVDSSVAAYLLAREGYDVVGVTMRLWQADDPSTDSGQAPSTDSGQALAITPDHQGCCSIEDIEDARRVCQTLGVPHYVLNVQDEFREHVVDYFTAEYARGRTPHPCIACNDRIKFDFLMRRAEMLEAEYVATGHYARVVTDPASGERALLKGVDGSKDQSYVLFNMTPSLLERVLLPVGWHRKTAIRGLAEEAGLHLWDKKDSQEICFIPQGDYREFLRKRSRSQPGELVHIDGRVLGTHRGIEFFTIGQRRGLGIEPTTPSSERLFVTDVDPDTRQVVLGPEESLYHDEIYLESVNFVGGRTPTDEMRVTAKIRYNGADAPATLIPSAGGEATLQFDVPQRAPTPGQAAVFYDGDRVVGGGYVTRVRVSVAR